MNLKMFKDSEVKVNVEDLEHNVYLCDVEVCDDTLCLLVYNETCYIEMLNDNTYRLTTFNGEVVSDNKDHLITLLYEDTYM